MDFIKCFRGDSRKILLGVPAVAVGLSAVSFSAALQKDAASIPNALGAARIQSPPYILIKVYFFDSDTDADFLRADSRDPWRQKEIRVD